MAIQPFALYNNVFHDTLQHCGDLDYDESIRRSGISANVVACLSLRKSIISKYESTNSAAEAKALQLFLECNDYCRRFKVKAHSSRSAILLSRLQSECRSFAQGLEDEIGDPKALFLNMGVGNGSNLLASGTSYYEKLYAGTVSVTRKGIGDLFKYLMSSHPQTREAFATRSSVFGDIQVVEHSKLSFVPKNEEIARTICTEPTVNMLFQKSVDAILRKHLLKYGIDLTVQQERNRELALEGSKADIGGRTLCTIDLKSASDLISLEIFDFLFGGTRLWHVLRTFRCETTKLPDGSVVPLFMVSSMGNGFTFSLQTAIFLFILKTVYNLHGRKMISYPAGVTCSNDARFLCNFGVNGDDIICERAQFDCVCELLECCGFMVNTKKTFSFGSFRESCGVDAYSGHNVRGVYCKKLDTAQDVYSLYNRLSRWSAQHKIPLQRTLSYLLRLKRVNFVPMSCPDTAGIHVPEMVFSKKKHHYGAYEPQASGWNAAALFTHDFSFLVKRRHDYRVFVNPLGLYDAILKGTLVGGRLVGRQTDKRYRYVEHTIPDWDMCVPGSTYSRMSGEAIRFWIETVTFNLWLNGYGCVVNNSYQIP